MSTDTALKNVEKLYPGSSFWDDLGNEPSFGGATRDSEDSILVDMGIDTSVDTDSSSDSLDHSDPAPSVQSFPLLVRAFQDNAFMAGSPSQVYGDRDTSSSQPQSSFGARDMLQNGIFQQNGMQPKTVPTVLHPRIVHASQLT